jgi:hypothetical protein
MDHEPESHCHPADYVFCSLPGGGAEICERMQYFYHQVAAIGL